MPPCIFHRQQPHSTLAYPVAADPLSGDGMLQMRHVDASLKGGVVLQPVGGEQTTRMATEVGSNLAVEIRRGVSSLVKRKVLTQLTPRVSLCPWDVLGDVLPVGPITPALLMRMWRVDSWERDVVAENLTWVGSARSRGRKISSPLDCGEEFLMEAIASEAFSLDRLAV